TITLKLHASISRKRVSSHASSFPQTVDKADKPRLNYLFAYTPPQPNYVPDQDAGASNSTNTNIVTSHPSSVPTSSKVDGPARKEEEKGASEKKKAKGASEKKKVKVFKEKIKCDRLF
ncbi:hypothetical protein Tco_1306052, partial [Tanacetum coccineum]